MTVNALENLNSILLSTKKLLGLSADYTAFDLDIVVYINSAFATLRELGIGPPEGFVITGEDEEWSEFVDGDARFNSVQTYVYLRVREVFDPPSNAFAVTAMKEQIRQHEWRLNTVREGDDWVAPATP